MLDAVGKVETKTAPSLEEHLAKQREKKPFYCCVSIKVDYSVCPSNQLNVQWQMPTLPHIQTDVLSSKE